ncbi:MULTISPECIES: type III polyketide synthase [Actinoalloteichus]|uniref:Type III polyketide synthase n=1 Tax=Actinoalloteichus fjordicus TaxID=1612552 RepID=A0AAC9LG15_9PSEU|nr:MULTISPECIES: 3-oxoacyl-[acyl-carrier-protein] synthase III C-terminal domain-containing protein [Actinoalloteichus]APU15670.1 hypothetical protein UA74_18210 [Actinoalloteichus fjordicus]APU21730.1 hypothetical protein UA75_18700 [Actinoalloteichus sp. GBA129-24]
MSQVTGTRRSQDEDRGRGADALRTAPPPRIASAATALPEHVYRQEEILAAFVDEFLPVGSPRRRAAERISDNAGVDTRHFAVPLEQLRALASFTEANEAYLTAALELGERAVRRALAEAGISPDEVDLVVSTTVTGLAVPSLEARLARRLGLREDVKRIPMFGLGCVAGAAGIARVADYLRAWPDQVAVLLAVELCSLTLQRDDVSVANVVGSSLFGDGAAAVVLLGGNRRGAAGFDDRPEAGPAATGRTRSGVTASGVMRAAPGEDVGNTSGSGVPGGIRMSGSGSRPGSAERDGAEAGHAALPGTAGPAVSNAAPAEAADGGGSDVGAARLVPQRRSVEGLRPADGVGALPEIIATRSRLYPDTEDVMGWDIGASGFRLVLSADVPTIAREFLSKDVVGFLADHGLVAEDVGTWICHPGGPKVIDAVTDSLALPATALAHTRESLSALGNLSSASVLDVLRRTLAQPRPPAGTPGLLLAMGPGFCAELVLLRW